MILHNYLPDPEMPIDGQWGPWRQESSCTKPCGHGLREEVRECDNPEPSGGLLCTGPWHQNASCNIEPCPEGFGELTLFSTPPINHFIQKIT